MHNIVTFIDIPSRDFGRAVDFYSQVFGYEIHAADVMGTQMGFFPSDWKNASAAIVYGPQYATSSEWVLVYLNALDKMDEILEKISTHWGQVLMPKTFVSDEVGYVAIFLDTEGNKLALHSAKN